jgi:multiple sugar transport system permease protein
MTAPTNQPAKHRTRGFATTLVIYVLLLIILVLIVVPLLWAIAASFTPNEKIYHYVFPFSWRAFFPQEFTLSAYRTLFVERGFGTAILNTVILSLGTVFIGGFINLLAGFAFAVFDFKGKNLLFGLVLFTFMVPIEVTILPQYIQMRNLGWINTWQGLLIPGLANSMVIFLFRQFFAEIPHDLLDAAAVDGASWLRILFAIVIPNSLPVLIGAGLVLLLSAWNSFFWPLVVAPKPEFRVIQVAISLSAQQRQTLLNELFAGSLIAAVVPVLIMLPLQQYYVKSIASTGIKE